MEITVNEGDTRLSRERLHRFFISHLDRIYCAKTHMLDLFRNIAELAHARDIYLAVQETADDIQKQIARMEEIYNIMSAGYNESTCVGMVSMLDEARAAVHDAELEGPLRDLSILFYLQNIESIEAASFQVLQLVSRSLDMPEVEQLVRENFDEAKEDRALLMTIARQYVAG